MNLFRKRPIPESLLTAGYITLTVFALRAVFVRYAEFLSKGRIVPSFIAISAAFIFGSVWAMILIWNPSRLEPPRRILERARTLRLALAAAVCVAPLILYAFLPWSEPFGATWIRAYLFTLALTVSARLIGREARLSSADFVSAAMIFSVSALIISQIRIVNAYPFSVGWSEGNRFWDYSVLFGRHLYDFPESGPIPAYIDLGRQSLWGAVFLLPKVSIVTMRAWNAVLFTVPYLILGWTLLRKSDRANETPRLATLSAVLWTMLFLNQGPIYTPLVLSLLIVAAARKTPAFIQIPLLAAAGAYAVLSRSTWIIAPPLFAAALAFIESDSKRNRWRSAIIVGLAALIGAFAYLNRESFLPADSGAVPNPEIPAAEKLVSFPTDDGSAVHAIEESSPAMFTPEWVAFYLSRQPLLWSRLFPNETYAPGILLGLLIAIAPLCVLLLIWDLRTGWKIDRIARILIVLMLLALCAVGLLISVKIGGGSNLHNLDMFLTGLVFVAALAWNAGFGRWLSESVRENRPLTLVLIAAILIPTIQTAFTLTPKVYPSAETTTDALEKINEIIAKNDGENILFIDQRQLLTFGNVPRIALIADYEKKWMMDEAMADHGAWFEKYFADLRSRRFNAIITEPLQIKFQGADRNFSEENDLFVKWVSGPTLCYYEPIETFPDQGVQILVPRAEKFEPEGVSCP